MHMLPNLACWPADQRREMLTFISQQAVGPADQVPRRAAPKKEPFSASAWKVEKLVRLLTEALKYDIADKDLWKPLITSYMNIVQRYLPLIFVESRRNPYKHMLLTAQAGLFFCKLAQTEQRSPNSITILANIKKIYSGYLKIQVAASIKLTGTQEIDLYIATLLLATANRSDSCATTKVLPNTVAKVQALYYAYPPMHTFKRLVPAAKLNVNVRKQLNFNQRLFSRAICMAITTYQRNSLFCHIHKLHELWPFLTHFSFRMLCHMNTSPSQAQRQGKIKAEHVLSKCPKLTSVHIDRLTSLKALKYPAKLLWLESDDTRNLADHKAAVEKCINIKSLKISNAVWKLLPKPEKLKKLVLYNRAEPLNAAFLMRLSNIETLKCCHHDRHKKNEIYDLSLLPQPESLKSLHITYCHYTQELLAQFTNLSKLHLRLDTMPVHAEVLPWLNQLPCLKILGLTPPANFLKILNNHPPCHHIEVLYRECYSHLDGKEIGLIKKKFPNLRVLRTRVICIGDQEIAHMALAKHDIKLLFKCVSP